MSLGSSLPPVPGLIPISALRKGSAGAVPALRKEFSDSSSNHNNNSNDDDDDEGEDEPCASQQKEVMGEQRPRRPGSQPREPIDIGGSRGRAATPQAPSLKERHHRKSERRRDKNGKRSRSGNPEAVSARVNPIFVWVRQEDTHIVDVKCEDYDKRNRIVLTKTAQGWRAIPRTETLVPNLKAAAAATSTTLQPQQQQQHVDKKPRKGHHHHHHHHHHKVKRKSAAVQVDEVEVAQDEEADDDDPPAWNDIESHLPSHTIQVHRKTSPEESADDDDDRSVNTSEGYTAQAPECSVSKLCDVSPLDNLLAVAELEFNQQIQTEAWREADMKICEEEEDTDNKNEHIDLPVIPQGETFESEDEKDDDCDYNEEDENNLAMDDILNRLEQSLVSPDVLSVELNEAMEEEEEDGEEEEEAPLKQEEIEEKPNSDLEEVISYENLLKEEELDDKTDLQEHEQINAIEQELVRSSTEATLTPSEPFREPLESDVIVESTTSITAMTDDDKPTDLTTKKEKIQCLTIKLPEDDLMPTDLSLPKSKKQSPKPSPRPSSRNSETIQSPQPSGLPAVPHSPDVPVSNKSAYLESLLSSTTQKISLNSEVTITRQKESDFGKSRKSASPTVTCSEEVNSSSREGEPEAKKTKLDDITLRKILDANSNQSKENPKAQSKAKPETSRLLELLTSESEPDALTQLKQLHIDPNVNLPDPMLIPKDRLSQILMSPGKEIPKLLSQRPELRLPEAFAFPNILQDPDILVITLAQLETIIRKQTMSFPIEKVKQQINNSAPVKKVESEANSKSEKDKAARQHAKQGQPLGKDIGRTTNEPNDINISNTNALNHMMWLPYLQQLEVAAMAFGNGDFFKMLSSAFPYSNQVPDLTQMLGVNRFPQPGFPHMQSPGNLFDFPLWPDPPGHPSVPRANYDNKHLSKTAYREYMEKMSPKVHQNPVHKYPKNHQFPFPPCNPLSNQNQFAFQAPMRPPNLQIPQFNPLVAPQKNSLHAKSVKSPPSPTNDPRISFNFCPKPPSQRYHSYNHKSGSVAKSKAAFNPLDCLAKNLQPQEHKKSEFAPQPMDLSGAAGGKCIKKSFDFGKSLKFDDIPEVGSTTSSLEEMAHMQAESQKHLWHPLFGNQKSSSNPWNWSPVAATGE